MSAHPKNSYKVSIIGCGRVGMTAAYALLLKGIVNELVLLGRCRDTIIGEELDLEHGMSFLGSATVHATENYADIADSDIVVVTAGASQKPGDTRLDLAQKNLAVIDDIIPQIVTHAPNSVILMVTNPVDVLTYRAYQLAKWPKGRIFGSGTVLDTARFRFHLSEFLHVNPKSIHAYILGEHGDSSFPVTSNATIGGQPLAAFPEYSPERVQNAFTKAQQAAYTIIASKGATFYGIGTVVSHIVDTVLRDAQSVLPVSIPLHDFYGHYGVSLSVPCIVGRNGVERRLNVKLSWEERQMLDKSVKQLQSYTR